MIAGAITRAGFGDMPPPAGGTPRAEVIVRSESAARLKPFALEAEALIFTIDIANRQGCMWRASLAVAAGRMPRLLPGQPLTLLAVPWLWRGCFSWPLVVLLLLHQVLRDLWKHQLGF